MAKKPTPPQRHYIDAEFLRSLGHRCRKLRVHHGYSIDRLAKESDRLSTSVIHRLESGTGAVTVLALHRYAQVLDVTVKDLLDF